MVDIPLPFVSFQGSNSLNNIATLIFFGHLAQLGFARLFSKQCGISEIKFNQQNNTPKNDFPLWIHVGLHKQKTTPQTKTEQKTDNKFEPSRK